MSALPAFTELKRSPAPCFAAIIQGTDGKHACLQDRAGRRQSAGGPRKQQQQLAASCKTEEAGTDPEQVRAGCQCLPGAAAAEGGALVGGAGEGDVAEVQHGRHCAQHGFPLGLPDANDGHGVQRRAQPLPIVHVPQRVAGLRAARGLVEVSEACSALLQPARRLRWSCGRHSHLDLSPG